MKIVSGRKARKSTFGYFTPLMLSRTLKYKKLRVVNIKLKTNNRAPILIVNETEAVEHMTATMLMAMISFFEGRYDAARHLSKRK
jgi:hypothetical protein